MKPHIRRICRGSHWFWQVSCNGQFMICTTLQALRDCFRNWGTQPHPYNDDCHVRGCKLCAKKFLEEHTDTLPGTARGRK